MLERGEKTLGRGLGGLDVGKLEVVLSEGCSGWGMGGALGTVGGDEDAAGVVVVIKANARAREGIRRGVVKLGIPWGGRYGRVPENGGNGGKY